MQHPIIPELRAIEVLEQRKHRLDGKALTREVGQRNVDAGTDLDAVASLPESILRWGFNFSSKLGNSIFGRWTNYPSG